MIAENDKKFKLEPITYEIKKATLKGVNIYNVSGDFLTIADPTNDKILEEYFRIF